MALNTDKPARWSDLAPWAKTGPSEESSYCNCRHFYVSIDDGLYLEKCVRCDKPKCV